MPYEIDFHSVGSGDNSGDAITMRYHDGAEWRVLVIDAGFQVNGEEIVQHVVDAYGTQTIDHVVSTHPHADHIGGLATVLSSLTVRNLWIHVPHLHAERISPLFHSSKWTTAGLAEALNAAYPAVGGLLELAQRHSIPVFLPFQGQRIGPFTVLSPSLAMYEGLLPQFDRTPKPDEQALRSLGHWLTGIGRRIAGTIQRIVREDAYQELLRDGGVTQAENESSVVLGGAFEDGTVLLTADAGLKALSMAADYAAHIGLPLQEGLSLFQVPHHGSRNNISPAILDRIIGPMALFDSRANTICIISAGPEDETHPRQIVVNALVRRGLRPFVTRGSLLNVRRDVEARPDIGPATPLGFDSAVEAYD